MLIWKHGIKELRVESLESVEEFISLGVYKFKGLRV